MSDLFPAALPLHISVPDGVGPETPVLVAVHGISRNSDEHFEAFRAACGSRAVVVAPHFAEEAHPSYQQLGLGRDGPRADLALDAALERLAAARGLDVTRFHLFGFSGGAQFAHRYAMLWPHRVRSLHLVAAGYYTFFDRAVSWPRGTSPRGPGREIEAQRNFFLRLPIHVYVGDADTDREEGLRTGARVDAQQGTNRLERARAWAAHVAELQSRHAMGASGAAGLTLLPGLGHDFAEGVRHHDLAGIVARRIGLAAPAPAPSPVSAALSA